MQGGLAERLGFYSSDLVSRSLSSLLVDSSVLLSNFRLFNKHLSKSMSSTFVVVGGGIAGVSCAEQLCSNGTVTLITASDVVKATFNLKQFGKTMEEFEVEQQPASLLFKHRPNVVVVQSQVVGFDPQGTDQESCSLDVSYPFRGV